MSLVELLTVDDLDIAVDPETYQDQVNPAPPLPGNYRLVATKIEPKKDKNGEVILQDGRFPIFTIQRAKIVEPTDAEREFGIFHDLRTKPFERVGAGGSKHVVTDIGDIIRSMDQSRQWKGLQEGVTALEELFGQNANFRIQAAWAAYDAAFVEAEFAKLGIAKDGVKQAIADGMVTKEVANGIYKKARLNTNAFKADGKGGRIPVAVGPSGNQLEARFTVKRFYPSLDEVVLGAYKVR